MRRSSSRSSVCQLELLVGASSGSKTVVVGSGAEEEDGDGGDSEEGDESATGLL